MSWIEIFVLSLVQGITEFLPVSSSAHLIIIPSWLGWADQGLSFDIAVHLGTLFAVIVYFRKELLKMVTDRRLFWLIALATIPVGFVGLGVRLLFSIRSDLSIIGATIGFAFVLWVADVFGKKNRSLETLDWKDALVIGCAQALSLIPGTSRSGITLTCGLFRGFSRQEAARFSFLLSIPVILLASGLESYRLLSAPEAIEWGTLLLAVGFSAISGFLCIRIFLKLLETVGLFPFVCYRFFLGAFLIWHFYA